MIDSISNRIKNTFKTVDGRGRDCEKFPIILIVDDDEDNRSMLKLLLEIWKYRVIEAANGLEAITIAENTRPDLILMDVKLPLLDGFSATVELRHSEKIENVPVIFLSACAEAIYKQKASDAGGNEYLTKPLDFEELEKTLGKYIHR